MNNCVFLGRLTRDLEVRYTANGKAVADVSIAVNTGNENADFFDLVAWEKTAENLSKYFKKGDLILVECSARQNTWEHEGQKRSKVVFNVNKFHFVGQGKKKEDSVEGGTPAPKTETTRRDTVPAPAEVRGEDEIPF